MNRPSWLRVSLRNRRDLNGLFFVLPFLVGFVFLFLTPFVQSVIFSLSELEITRTGYNLNYVGFHNYNRALFINADFVPIFVGQVQRMLISVPAILIFSFFAALLLNGSFRGRGLARVIFFLPVIMSAGVLLQVESADFMTDMLQSGGFSGAVAGADIKWMLYQLRLPVFLIELLVATVESIPEIIRKSGIQILVFLTGLQSISGDLYEAADMEGCTGWERFWLITFPLMTPLIVTNVVFSIVDSFTAGDNELVSFINSTAFGGMGYGVSVAMSWMYFAAVAVMLAIVLALTAKRTYYMS